MAEILQLSDEELPTTGITTPRTLVDTVEARKDRQKGQKLPSL